MPKTLVLYYSTYGHTMKLARAVADGAKSAGSDVTIRRVEELVPDDVAKERGFMTDQPYEVATVDELPDYDAILVGTPTRYGNMASQMKSFLDQTGALWQSGALVGKVGGAFTSTATQHGGQESTILTTHTVLLHLGLVIVGLPYSFQGQMTLDAISGCSPYGPSTIAGGDGSRQPSENELAGARFFGDHAAKIAAKLAA